MNTIKFKDGKETVTIYLPEKMEVDSVVEFHYTTVSTRIVPFAIYKNHDGYTCKLTLPRYILVLLIRKREKLQIR